MESISSEIKEIVFDKLFFNSIEKYIVMDKGLKILMCSKSALEILGYNENIIGQNFKNFIMQKDIPEFDKFISALNVNEIVKNFKFYLMTSNGTISRFFLSGILLKSNDHVKGYLISFSISNPQEWASFKEHNVFFQFITRKLGKLTSLGKLTTIFAHDIKTPIHVIYSTAQLMSSNNKLPEDIRENFKMIERNAERASKIIKTLMDFSKSGICQMKPFSLNEVVESAIEMVDTSLKTSKIIINKDFGDLPEVYLDNNYISSIIYNLLTNSIEAIGENKGEINIKTFKDKNEVKLLIEDNGIGMDEATLSNLFQPFFTTKDSGTGLGLYLARQIMNEHNGDLLVESEKGKGTKVTLIFRKFI